MLDAIVLIEFRYDKVWVACSNVKMPKWFVLIPDHVEVSCADTRPLLLDLG